MNEFKKIGNIILDVLHQVEFLIPSNTVGIINELVEHDEVGIALETLCSQIFEYDIELSVEQNTVLKDIALLLSIPVSQLEGLSD
nr:MafI family immunity protein [Herbaspirillum sp. ASV7]